MMFPSFLGSVGIAVLAAGATSGPTHAWIADIKARRAGMVGQEVRLEGEVVDVRSTSPTARRGYYRLTDASDPTGVLVRTERVPIDGGSFRLRAKLADDQIVNGTLLLDEIDRERTDARPLLPVIAVLVSGLTLTVLMVLLRRAYAAERLYAVAPPLWLLPDAGPYGKGVGTNAPGQPSLKYDPELEEADRQQRFRLQRRKRRLFQSIVGTLAVAASSVIWVLGTKPVSGQVPAFIFIDSPDPTVRGLPARTASSDTAVAVQGARIGGDSALSNPLANRPDPARDRPKLPVAAVPATATRSPVTAPRTGDPAVKPDTARREASAPPPVPVPSPPPAPQPSPPPAPPPAAEPVAPVRDPVEDQARAHTRLAEAAGQLVAAINAKRATDVALMLPEAMAGDLGRRERFLKLVRDFSPRASLGSVDEATVTDDRGEARIAIAFAWRGDFGVDKKKTGRLQAIVRRDGDGWRFEGARLLDPVP